MNRIVIGSFEFTDENILENPRKFISNSMLADNLEIDTLEFTVFSYGVGTLYIITSDGYTFATSSNEPYVVDEGEFLNIPYATPVYLYKDYTLRAKFFVESITRTGLQKFEVRAVSAIGLLDKATTAGGIYTGETAGSIIASLMSDAGYTDYSIDQAISPLPCHGWIPAGSVRDALNQVLFAFGASILKGSDGSLYIYFIGGGNPTNIVDSAVYIGGSVGNPASVTDVNLYEHFFTIASDNAEEVLFDNTLGTAASSLIMYFDEPYHSYRATGTLVVNSSGANYAVVTGIGQLFGKKYTHTRRLLTQNIRGGEKNVVNVPDATLVSAANSSNCLARLVNYYTNAQEINLSIIDSTGIKPGDYVQVTDPFQTTVTGFIQEIEEVYSDTDKADSKIITNWTPSNMGNTYDSYVIVTDADLVGGVWTPDPELVGKDTTIVLFGGASGGQGGEAGASPPLLKRGDRDGYTLYEADNGYGLLTAYDEVGGISNQAGGKGGKGGKGGDSASRTITFNQTLGASHNVTFGVGGAGGTGGSVTRDATLTANYVDPTDGQEGGDSTFDSYTTLNGTTFRGTYVNLITGEILAQAGEDGVDGGDGGDGGNSMQKSNQATATAWTTTGKGANGQSVNGHTGGAGASGVSGIQYSRTPSWYIANGGGGGGGGASYDANGSAGTAGTNSIHSFTERTEEQGNVDVRYYNTGDVYEYFNSEGELSSRTFKGAKGGDGASATTVPSQPLYKGGTGGNGGGGGGGSGAVIGSYWRYHYTGTTDLYYGAGLGGLGGDGGNGGQGSNGFMIIYYKA